MSIKSIIRNKLSPKQMKALKWVVMQYRYIKTRKHLGECIVNEDYVDSYEIIGLPNKHVFFGYYDLQQLDKSGQRALIHIIDKNRCNPAEDLAGIAIYHIDEKKTEVLTQTRAWSWQQGARLRWHPCKPETVLFNDVEDGKYVTVECDIISHSRETIAPMPMYDVTPDMHYGLSVNFSRLQRLRPGYGYSTLKDDTAGISSLKEEGIFRYDFEKQESKLLISLDQLAHNCPKLKNVEHYINHISIAPSGRKFMFFHLWASIQSSIWDMNLYVADIETGEMNCIETEEIASHYSWRSDSELLVTTAALHNSQSKYILYNLDRHSKQVLKGKWLTRDGHPTAINDSDCFVSDTYPIGCEQFLFLEEREVGTELARVYADPRMFDDMRCDLHPRVSLEHKQITIDSTFNHKVRQVVLLRMRNGVLESKIENNRVEDEKNEYIIVGLGNQNNAIKEMFYEVIHGEIKNASYIEPFCFHNRLLKFINRVIYSRKLRKFFKWIPQNVWEKYHILNKLELDRKKTTYIILTYGTDTDRLHFPNLIDKLRKEYRYHVKFVLMLFDPVDSPLQSQGWNRILDVTKEFDITATFDKNDAEKYGMLFFTDPYSKRIIEQSGYAPHSDVFFVGADKGRGWLLNQIANKLNAAGVNSIMKVVGIDSSYVIGGLEKQDKYLPYEETLQYVSKTDCLLEVLCDNQSSSSLRYYEAVVYNKKLLTNNPNIINMPYYNPLYMKVFTNSDDIDINWLKTQMDINYNYDGGFSINSFLDSIKKQDSNNS